MHGPSALGHLIQLVAWLLHHAHRGKHLYVKSFDLSFQSATIVVISYMCILDKRNTLWLRDMANIPREVSSRQADRKSAPAADFPYGITKKYSYYIWRYHRWWNWQTGPWWESRACHHETSQAWAESKCEEVCIQSGSPVVHGTWAVWRGCTHRWLQSQGHPERRAPAYSIRS